MPPRKMTTLLADLLAFGQNLKEVPYDEIETTVAEAGYKILLTEVGMTPCPDATVLASFDIMVGREDVPLEKLDTVTMRMPQQPGPISIAARVSAKESVIFMVTGRLPPRPNTAPASDARPAPTMNGHEIDLDMGDEDVALPEDLPDEPDEPVLNLVERTEPDGLPILRDLDAIDPQEATSDTIIESLLDLVDGYVASASLEQLNAFAAKNAPALSFVASVGSAEQRNELLSIVNNRRKALQPATAAAPRRRSAAN